MNKYEQLIEAIIKEDEKLAQEIFHQIVVERSRQIYESILENEMEDDEDIEGLVDELEAEEVNEGLGSILTIEEAKALMDFVDSGYETQIDSALLEKVADFYGLPVDESLAAKLEESSDDLMNVAYGSVEDEADEDMVGDEEEYDYDNDGELDSHEEDHGDLEGRVDDLESEFAELQAEFDALMADEEGEEEGEEDGDEDSEMDFDDSEATDDEEFDDEAEEPEEEQPVKETARSRSPVDIMREYVEKVSAPSNSDTADNKSSVVAGKNDMGGTAKNLAQGGSETNPDGDKPHGKAGGFLKSPQVVPVAAKNVNKVGGNAGAQNFFDKKAKAAGKEPSGVNKKSIESGSGS